MKRIIIIIAGFLLASMAHGMQKADYTINPPYYDSRSQEYVIEAIGLLKRPIGSLIYHRTSGSDTSWQMRKLEVDSNYHRNGIAHALFAQCIKNIKVMNALQLEWKALPKDADMSEEQLIAIYLQIIKKYNPALLQKATLEYRGNENLQSPWLILNL